MSKVQVCDVLQHLDHDLEGDLDDVIQYLTRLKEDNPGYNRLVVHHESDYDISAFYLHGFRDETPEEETERFSNIKAELVERNKGGKLKFVKRMFREGKISSDEFVALSASIEANSHG